MVKRVKFVWKLWEKPNVSYLSGNCETDKPSVSYLLVFVLFSKFVLETVGQSKRGDGWHLIQTKCFNVGVFQLKQYSPN